MIFKKPKGNQNKMKPRGRKRKLFASAMLILRLFFGGLQSASASSNPKTFQSGGNSKTEISRTLDQESSMIANLNQEDSTRSELVPEGGQLTLDTPSGQITLGLPRGGEWQPKSGPGPRAKADARKAAANRAGNSKAGNSQSGGSPFAEAFTVEPKFPARPGRNEDGLFGRFTPQPTPDPHNPGCAGGPRSITVLSGQQNQSEYQPDGYSEEQILMFEKNPRYSELSKDPQLVGQERETNPKSKEEACTILQAEDEGLVSGARRPNLKAGDPNYDYKTNSPKKFSEIKVPRDASLEDAARLGRKSGLQRGKDGDVTIVVNLMRLRPEKRGPYAEVFLEAAGGDGVIFINN